MQKIKKFGMLGVMFSVIIGFSVFGFSEQEVQASERLSIHEMSENEITNVLEKYIFVNDKGIKQFDLSSASKNNELDEILEVGNQINLLGADIENMDDSESLSHRIKRAAQLNPTKYGKYCGKGNQGKGQMPIDDLDTACMYHDYCYVHGGSNKSCNKSFNDRLAAVIKNAKKGSWKWTYAKAAKMLF